MLYVDYTSIFLVNKKEIAKPKVRVIKREPVSIQALMGEPGKCRSKGGTLAENEGSPHRGETLNHDR